MTDDWQKGVPLLLHQCHSGFLASMGEHGPEVSMAPFVVYQGNIVLHLSTLARHTKNITGNSAVGFMVCTPENLDSSPLSLPRLSIQGNIIAISDTESEIVKQAYLKHSPDAEQLFSFDDFRIFCIVPSHVQWIGGFGAARKITVSSWNNISTYASA
ncbi:MAG: pyridoxamine 5'-phosphate oxidase family protein [Mariprofundaceae bacterium]|nr:pyridoxamine 5'-phosphate oxidase family protein [Mariprofundaceae bacterium]